MHLAQASAFLTSSDHHRLSGLLPSGSPNISYTDVNHTELSVLFHQYNGTAIEADDGSTNATAYHQTPWSVSAGLVLGAASNCAGAASVLANLLVVFALHLIKDKSAAYYSFIYSLAMADMLAAATFLVTQHWPYWSFLLVDPQQHLFLAHALGYLSRSLPWLFFTAYLLTLCCLSASQFVAVCRPWQFSSLVSVRAVRLSVAAVWLVSALQIVVPVATFIILLTKHQDDDAYVALFRCSYVETHVWISFYALVILINLLLHLVTYVKLKAHRRTQAPPRRLDHASLSAAREAFVTLTTLLAATVTCRVPFPIIGIVALNIDFTVGVDAVQLVDTVIILLLHTNFLVDPIIIIGRTKDIKVVLCTFVRVCARRHHCCRPPEMRVLRPRNNRRPSEHVQMFSLTTRLAEG